MPLASNVRPYIKLTRPENVAGSVITYCIGYFLAKHNLSWDFFISLVIMAALHSIATLQNDIEDFEIDKANRRQGVLQSKGLSFAQTKSLVQFLAFTALAAALLSGHRRLNLIAILVLGLIAWSYNSKPFRASRRPVASILLMGLCYGACPFAYGYFIGNGKIANTTFWLMAALWFLARVSTAIMKDYKDAKGDKKFKKITFYLRYGPAATGRVSFGLALVAYGGITALLLFRPKNGLLFVLSLLLTAGLALKALTARYKLLATTDEKKLNAIFHQSVFRHNRFEAGVLLCLLLS